MENINKRHLFFSLIVITVLFFNINVYVLCKTDTREICDNPNPNLTLQQSTPLYSLNEVVVIIVENSLWGFSSIQSAVNQYEQDLKDTGYTTILYTNTIANVQALRNLLQSWYIFNSISGVVLIGNLPYARYYHPATTGFSAETFICDLYLMDLDGLWWDLNTDGVYDKHNASVGADIYPEIYLGRIDATNRNLGGLGNTQNIINLLNRVHSYRIGGVARTHRAITYIDDDWQLWADGTYDNWPGWLINAYSNRVDVHTPTTYTNATDWLNTRITQDYEFAHLCAHSGASPGTHYFGPGGSGEGTITSTQIHNVGPAFNFYNLFCCHGADWITLDSLAMTYLFSGSCSITVIGSSKTGGMLSGSNFYNSLANNNTIGKGLNVWFQSMDSYVSTYLEWFYGMCILGDPFATIHYDCTILTPKINSTTHPDPNIQYKNKLPQFTWSIPPDVNGIIGYYYIIDQSPLTLPNASSGIYTSSNGLNVSTSLSDGTWYIHVIAKDGAGNIGIYADHYQVNIKTPPKPKIPSFSLGIIIFTLLISIGTYVSRHKI